MAVFTPEQKQLSKQLIQTVTGFSVSIYCTVNLFSEYSVVHLPTAFSMHGLGTSIHIV